MTHILFKVPTYYPYVLMTAASISFLCLLIGFGAGSKRGKIFDKEKIKEKFGDAHQEAFGSDPPAGGYPDHGNGLYGDLLSYKDWFEFQLDQRTHKNFLEQVTIIVFLVCNCGLVWPIVAICLGIVHFVGRIIYTIGYKKSVQGRMIGAMFTMLSLFALLICAMITTIMMVVAIP